MTGHVDGDTIDVAFGERRERLRLVGIDTPEVARDGRPAECYAERASARLAELLPIGSRVRVERDIVPRDDYGRLLGYLYAMPALGAGAGSAPSPPTLDMINLVLVREGLARPMTFPPNDTFADDLADAALTAERVGAGLWAECRR